MTNTYVKLDGFDNGKCKGEGGGLGVYQKSHYKFKIPIKSFHTHEEMGGFFTPICEKCTLAQACVQSKSSDIMTLIPDASPLKTQRKALGLNGAKINEFFVESDGTPSEVMPDNPIYFMA